jgi:hypothetical protein
VEHDNEPRQDVPRQPALILNGVVLQAGTSVETMLQLAEEELRRGLFDRLQAAP